MKEMKTFKFNIGDKLMANIASPRNAESFGRLILYTVVARISFENSAGIVLSYEVRPADIRDGTIYPAQNIEEESLKSVDEYNERLKDKK